MSLTEYQTPKLNRFERVKDSLIDRLDRCWTAAISLPFVGSADCFTFWYMVVSFPFYFVRFPTDAEGVLFFCFHIILTPLIPCVRKYLYQHRGKHVLILWFVDLYPLILFFILYSEVAVLNQRIHGGKFFDSTVVDWEDAMFGTQVSQKMWQWIDSKAFGEYLHFCYFSYYGIIASLPIVLFLTRSRTDFLNGIGCLCLTFYFGFVIFILFPVEGPFWYLHPPDPHDVGYAFSHLCNWLVSGGSANGTAFPSTHTSISITCWILAYRYHYRLFLSYFLVIPGLILSTMYGGFHYAVDIVAGVVLGVFSGTVGHTLACIVQNFLMVRQEDYLSIDDDSDYGAKSSDRDFAGSLDLFATGPSVV